MNSKAAPKDKLFQTAARLFYQHGYRAIGVDTISAESGIGKMTLYRHYPSKDDLIVAFLRQSDEDFWEYFEQSTQDASTAREKLLAFFAALQKYVVSPACYGCPFLNVATEYPETEYAGHQVALEHKQAVRAQFNRLAQAANARQPEALANALFLLMDGAYMAARMFGSSSSNPAVDVAEAARHLIDAYCEA
jgi:AcrR family transcriptional regulator